MYDAIVLAGGAGRRLGGADKGAIDVGGRTLLERVLAAVRDAGVTIVVGGVGAFAEGVIGTSERPPGGGPVAGVAAGLELTEAAMVAVLACDLPFVTARTMATLVERLGTDSAERADGAMLVDQTGRPQPLAAVYRRERLVAALAALETPRDAPMRAVLEQMIMLEVPAESGEAWDCDTWTDVDRARGRAVRPLEEA